MVIVRNCKLVVVLELAESCISQHFEGDNTCTVVSFPIEMSILSSGIPSEEPVARAVVTLFDVSRLHAFTDIMLFSLPLSLFHDHRMLRTRSAMSTVGPEPSLWWRNGVLMFFPLCRS